MKCSRNQKALGLLSTNSSNEEGRLKSISLFQVYLKFCPITFHWFILGVDSFADIIFWCVQHRSLILHWLDVNGLGIRCSLSVTLGKPLSEYVRICQNISEYGRICQNMSEYFKIWQNMSEYGRIWQTTVRIANCFIRHAHCTLHTNFQSSKSFLSIKHRKGCSKLWLRP